MEPITVLSLFNGMSCAYMALEKAGIPIKTYYSSEIDKYAIAESQENFPDIIQLGDVTKWEEWDIDWSSIDLLMGGFPCFPEGTMIMTNKGHKDIKDIEIGDMVLTHTGQYREVINKGEKYAPTRVISGQGHLPIECTDEHPFYVRERIYTRLNGNLTRSFKEPEWIKSEHLTKDSFLCHSPKTCVSNTSSHDTHYWYFIGRYIGDGWSTKSKKRKNKDGSVIYSYTVNICCAHNEFDELVKCFDEFGYHYNYEKKKTTYKFYIYSKELYDNFIEMGHGAHNKKLPSLIFFETIENKKALLDGYLASDGFRLKNKNGYGFSTVSLILSCDLQRLIYEVYGKVCSMRVVHPPEKNIIDGREINQRTKYCGEFILEYSRWEHTFEDNDYIWFSGAKKNISTGTWKTVYNIEVDIDNTYTANNIVVHNCQAWSNAGKHGGVNDIRGQLFLTMIDIFEHIKSLNPNVKYLFENVKMKKDFEEFINDKIGQTPILINSQNYTAHYRQRYYWISTDNLIIPPPLSLSPNLSDIIESGWYTDRIKSYCIDANYAKGADPNQYFTKSRRQMVFSSPDINREELIKNGKNGLDYRKLTVVECCKLQGVDPEFFKVSSNTQAYKMLGNGWTVPVIEHLLREIFDVDLSKQSDT